MTVSNSGDTFFRNGAVHRCDLLLGGRSRAGAYEVGVEQEPGSGGKESAESTIRNLRGFKVYADKVTGSKEIRAEPDLAGGV